MPQNQRINNYNACYNQTHMLVPHRRRLPNLRKQGQKFMCLRKDRHPLFQRVGGHRGVLVGHLYLERSKEEIKRTDEEEANEVRQTRETYTSQSYRKENVQNPKTEQKMKESRKWRSLSKSVSQAGEMVDNGWKSRNFIYASNLSTTPISQILTQFTPQPPPSDLSCRLAEISVWITKQQQKHRSNSTKKVNQSQQNFFMKSQNSFSRNHKYNRKDFGSASVRNSQRFQSKDKKQRNQNKNISFSQKIFNIQNDQDQGEILEYQKYEEILMSSFKDKKKNILKKRFGIHENQWKK